MSLPDLTQVKDRLRIEHDVEDDDLELMRASALAQIEETIGRPIYATERTFVVDSPSTRWDGETAATAFFLPLYPVDPTTVEMTDSDEVAVDAADFRVNGVTGRVSGIGTVSWSLFPMTVTATVGLDLMDGFATRIEPKLSQAFLDLCIDWYQRRNPGAIAEGAGGGVITQWQTLGVPERICHQLDAYRLTKAH